jgi:hypothetical protein
VRASLQELLDRARAASPNDRIELRDEIAAHGSEAIGGVQSWLADPDLWRFAVRVIGRAADLGSRQAAVDVLRKAGKEGSLDQRVDIDVELARLGAPGITRSGEFGPLDYEAIRDRLIFAAKRGDVVNYADLAEATGREMKGPHWAVHIGRILGRISTQEAEDGRPLLSAIVVSRDSKLPGEGFFTLGQELQKVERGEDESAFARRQMRRVYEYWQAKGQSGSS